MPKSAIDFSNRSVLITGGGRGIGKRLAIGFAQLGSKVALVARSKAELDIAHIEIQQNGGNSLCIAADVGDAKQMAAAVDQVFTSYGGPDILICAAGVPGPIGAFGKTEMAAWTAALQTNLLGTVYAVRAALPGMTVRRRGKIIVLVSETGGAPPVRLSSYVTAKTAVVRFVEAVAAEAAEDNIQINCLDPGPAYTSFTDEIARSGERGDPKLVAAAVETRTTGGASPEDQLKITQFLASDLSNHITGRLFTLSDDWNRLKDKSLRPELLTLRRIIR